jgi:hypothetical protein
VVTEGAKNGETDLNTPAPGGLAQVAVPQDTVRHLTQRDLAARWRTSERTLERRRYLRQGPLYVKIGSLVRYRLEDILAYEAAKIRGDSK